MDPLFGQREVQQMMIGKHFYWTSCAFAVAVALGACGGGDGSSSAGIGGSGVVATGAITGFGSVFVNGVEYTTRATNFTVGEAPGTEADLAIGMVVRVNGSLNDDGATGTAESIVYDRELEGPIANAPVMDPDGETKSFTVLGRNVVVDHGTTVFDDNVPGFAFGTIAQNHVVEVSGFFDVVNNTLFATRIEKEDTFDPGNPGATEVEVEGTISNYNEGAGTFNLGTLTVTFDGNTEIPDGGLKDDLFVEVEGPLQDAAATMIAAREIEIEDDYPDDADKAEIQGVVAGFTDLDSVFTVNGQSVDASGPNVEFEPSSLASAIDNGMEIEVEGPIVNSILIVREVKRRGGNVEIEAVVQDVNPTAKTLTLYANATSAKLIVVNIDESTTEFENDEDDKAFGLADILPSDFVEIKGYQTDTGVVATKVKRDEDEPEDEVKFEGPVESWNEMDETVTLLGVTFGTDGDTDFESDDVDFANAADFFAALGTGDIVKVKDELPDGMMSGDGVAKEVEIED